MKNIKINPVKFAQIVLDNAEKAGSTEWDIYADENGNLAIRHNTYNNNDWYEIYDLYYGYDADQLECESIEQLADWMVSDGIDFSNLNIEEFNDETGDLEPVVIEFE
jgi:hypothetical protein